VKRAVKLAVAHAAPVFMDTEVVPGFPYWINCYPPLVQGGLNCRYRDAAITADGPELARIRGAAREAGVAVALGFCEREAGTLYNAIAFVERDGTLLGVHRKLQPTYAERYIWGRGDASTLSVFESSVGRVGGLACWEHTMNLARQALVEQGIEIHVGAWPSLSTMAGFESVADRQIEAMMRNHALTGQCFVLCASSPVGPDVLPFLEAELGPQEFLKPGGGWSAIIHPFTPDLAGPHAGAEEELLSAEIDLGELGDVKMWLDGAGHYARPELLWMVMDDRPKRGLVRRSEEESD
jgi:predicted amidohydrolase